MKKLFLVLALAISIINGEEDIPEECKIGNHKDLVGKFHEHRHLGYRTSNEFLTMNIHERAENYSVGFDNWFRFRTTNAKRLLEATELPTVLEDKNARTFYPCGTIEIPRFAFVNGQFTLGLLTSDILVLNDTHPKRKYEILLTTTIGCYYLAYASGRRVDCVTKNRDGSQFLECSRHLNCRTDTIPIAVRNCGDFFIYKSQIIPDKGKITGVLCGTKNETSKAFSALTAPPITGTRPPVVACPNTLCKGKADGNFKYADPATYKVNKNYFLQCLGGEAYCQACWPLSLEFSENCNRCLYTAQDECVTTAPFVPATTFKCPDKCPHRGPTYTGNIADPHNKRHYVGCFEGATVGCVACPGYLEFNEKENACLFEGKFITKPTKHE